MEEKKKRISVGIELSLQMSFLIFADFCMLLKGLGNNVCNDDSEVTNEKWYTKCDRYKTPATFSVHGFCRVTSPGRVVGKQTSLVQH